MRLTRSVRREEKSSLGEIGGEGANNEYSEMRKRTTLSANVIVLRGDLRENTRCCRYPKWVTIFIVIPKKGKVSTRRADE